MKSKIISILFTIVILDLLGFGIIIPILPVLFIKTQFNLAILHQLFPLVKQEYILYGLIVAAYPFAQFFSAPILGQLSDKYGRKQILFYCLAATSLSYFLAVLGIRMTSFPILLLSRVLGGIMGGNIAIAQAVAADITEVKDRTRVYGLLGAAFGIGFILGPYLGGKLSDSNLVSWFHLDTPFLMAGLLSFVSVVVTWLFLPETHPYEKRQLKLRFGQSISDIKAALSHKRLNTLFLVGFLFQFAFTMFVSFFGVLLFKRYSFTQVSIGEYFAFAGLWIAITQIFLTKFISRVLGNKAMLAFGLLGCCTM
ncbi:MAG: MFS transporter, partial [Microgenomates group bacterium]